MLKKILLVLLVFILLLAIGFYVFVEVSWDKKFNLEPPALTVSKDSAVIARGKYLVNGPAHCISCHVSGFDDMVRADEGKEVSLQGGTVFELGPIGAVVLPNLTSDTKTGLGRYSDGQIFRMLRNGIKPNGLATLTVLMPFHTMADEDLVAIVSYLRTLPPVEHEVPPARWTFMGKAVRSLAPTFKPIDHPVVPAKAPAMAATVERGAYLAKSVCNCIGCHTERDQMTFEAVGPEFAGGFEFEPDPALYKYFNADTDMWLRSANLTPYSKSALARFPTAADWIKRFREGRKINVSPMDWGPFSRMSDEDLTALWMFFNTLKPVDKDISTVFFKKEKDK